MSEALWNVWEAGSKSAFENGSVCGENDGDWSVGDLLESRVASFSGEAREMYCGFEAYLCGPLVNRVGAA